jgi:glycosyltransferase involved in cell wall biosynthesis
VSPATPAPLVTVVIPTHNRSHLLRRTLGTVLAQREVDFEVIVVDDGSHDQTAASLNSVTDPRVRVVRHSSATGVAAARNSGLDVARGQWVAFVDDDDLWAPDKLAAQVRAAGAHPGAGWVVVGEVTVDPSLRVLGGRRPPHGREFAEVLRYNIVPAGGSGTMVRTDLARSLGGFNTDLTILADWDLWIRLFLAAPAAQVSRPLVAYRVHPSSMSHDTSSVAEELEVLLVAYGPARRQHRIRFLHLPWLQWLICIELERGDRAQALRTALGTLGHLGELPAFVPVFLGGVRRSRRRSRRWRRESAAWLAASARGQAECADACYARRPTGRSPTGLRPG